MHQAQALPASGYPKLRSLLLTAINLSDVVDSMLFIRGVREFLFNPDIRNTNDTSNQEMNFKHRYLSPQSREGYLKFTFMYYITIHV